MEFKSNTLRRFGVGKDCSATERQQKFLDQVYLVCEKNYDAGGDLIVESWSPRELLATFGTMKHVKQYLGARVSMELDRREGNDDDPELLRYERFKNADWSIEQ